MTLVDTLLFALVASLLSLDQVACFQFYLSRPIVVAVVLGLLLSDPVTAVMIGVVFECLFARTIPLKERAAADPTLATAVTLGALPDVSSLSPGQLMNLAPFAAGFGLLCAFVSKWFDIRLRRGVNVTLAQSLRSTLAIQSLALAILFVKSFGFYFMAILAAKHLLFHFDTLIGLRAMRLEVLFLGHIAWGGIVVIAVGCLVALFYKPSITGHLFAGFTAGLTALAVCSFAAWPISHAVLIVYIGLGLAAATDWMRRPRQTHDAPANVACQGGPPA